MRSTCSGQKTDGRAIVFNGAGAEATRVGFSRVAKGRIEPRKIQVSKTLPLSCEITLGQAIRRRTWTLIIERGARARRCGDRALLRERTVVRADEARRSAKRDKGSASRFEAAKPSGQNWLPRGLPMSPKECLRAGRQYDLMLIARRTGRGFREASDAELLAPKRPRIVLVLVGPEGDFLTLAEINLAKNHGCRPITISARLFSAPRPPRSTARCWGTPLPSAHSAQNRSRPAGRDALSLPPKRKGGRVGLRHATRNRVGLNLPWVRIPPLPPMPRRPA